MTIGVPIVTCLLRVRRIHKAETLQTPSCGDATRGCSPVPPPSPAVFAFATHCDDEICLSRCTVHVRYIIFTRHYFSAALDALTYSPAGYPGGLGPATARLAAGPPAPFQTCVNFAFTACRLADFAPFAANFAVARR